MQLRLVQSHTISVGHAIAVANGTVTYNCGWSCNCGCGRYSHIQLRLVMQLRLWSVQSHAIAVIAVADVVSQMQLRLDVPLYLLPRNICMTV